MDGVSVGGGFGSARSSGSTDGTPHPDLNRQQRREALDDAFALRENGTLRVGWREPRTTELIGPLVSPPQRCTRRINRTLFEEGAPVALACSRSGKFVAALYVDTFVNGNELQQLAVYRAPEWTILHKHADVASVAWHPRAEILAISLLYPQFCLEAGKHLKFYHAESQEFVFHCFPNFDAPCTHLAWSSDGHNLSGFVDRSGIYGRSHYAEDHKFSRYQPNVNESNLDNLGAVATWAPTYSEVVQQQLEPLTGGLFVCGRLDAKTIGFSCEQEGWFVTFDKKAIKKTEAVKVEFLLTSSYQKAVLYAGGKYRIYTYTRKDGAVSRAKSRPITNFKLSNRSVGQCHAMQASHEGTMLAIAHGNYVSIMDVATDKFIWSFCLARPATTLAWSHDLQQLFVGTQDCVQIFHWAKWRD